MSWGYDRREMWGANYHREMAQQWNSTANHLVIGGAQRQTFTSQYQQVVRNVIPAGGMRPLPDVNSYPGITSVNGPNATSMAILNSSKKKPTKAKGASKTASKYPRAGTSNSKRKVAVAKKRTTSNAKKTVTKAKSTKIDVSIGARGKILISVDLKNGSCTAVKPKGATKKAITGAKSGRGAPKKQKK